MPLHATHQQDVFDCAQREYMDEGVPWSVIEYNSNSKILELLEGKMGVIALLNEECMLPKVGAVLIEPSGAHRHPFPPASLPVDLLGLPPLGCVA